MQPGHPQGHPSRPTVRPPGTFSPLPAPPSPSTHPRRPSAQARPPPLRIDSSSSESGPNVANATMPRTRLREASPATPIYNHFTSSHTDLSSPNMHQNFSRPAHSSRLAASAMSPPLHKSHARKHPSTPGLFDSTLPSTATSNLSQVAMNQSGPAPSAAAAAAAAASAAASTTTLTASQIAAQAAIMSHQNTSQLRQRSQTVPVSAEANEEQRRGSSSKPPSSPPQLSLTEASLPRDAGSGLAGGQHLDRLAGPHSSAATAAASVVLTRSGHSSPREKPASPRLMTSMPPPPPPLPDKAPLKAEKSKVKLFSRQGKSGATKAEAKERTLPSPGKLGSTLSALQRGNFSTSSLVEPPTQSLYSLSNSSSATIRPIDSLFEDKGKEKEKKHHFLHRQKQKLKDDYHLALSSAASNSKPTDPNAPSSLYNFNVPASPGPNSAAFVKTKKERRLAERSDSRLDGEPIFGLPSDWPTAGGSSSSGLWPSSASSSTAVVEPAADGARTAAQGHLSPDNAWNLLRSKLLLVFEGEDLRIPVEDLNRVVQMHLQWCVHMKSPGSVLDNLRDLLSAGFSSLDRILRHAADELFIPTLVELWLFAFTSILPYLQSVFLPLELEVSGRGVILPPDQAREFWASVVASSMSASSTSPSPPPPPPPPPLSSSSPGRASKGAAAAAAAASGRRAMGVLDVRRLVLAAFRDIIILPRYETLKGMFSRLSLEFLPSSVANMLALSSSSSSTSPPAPPPPLAESTLSASPSDSLSSSILGRPGTAMSLDPSLGSFNSNGTTLLGDGSERGRSRALSNVSFGSLRSESGMRPFTSSGVPTLSSVREQNVQDSKQVTDMVGRMLQCMSVLSSLGAEAEPAVAGNGRGGGGNAKMVELCKMLKLNWLGRGRTGRNRRGIVGGRVRRTEGRDEVRVA